MARKARKRATKKEDLTAWQRWCAQRPGRVIPGYDADATAGEGDWFDADAADAALEFIALTCVFISGRGAGKPVVLEAWQDVIVGALWGWKRADGTRRYREAFIEVPRKNGKSTLIGCVIILGMVMDGEPGAELYSAAGDADQAALVYNVVAGMVENSELLADEVVVHRGGHRAYIRGDRTTFYRSISAEGKTKHGFNAYIAVLDELHTQPDRELFDVLKTSMMAREQPLFISITTADLIRPSICNEREELALNVARGLVKMRELLPVLYRLEPGEDWKDPANWKKANPNLGISISEEDFRERFNEALETPSFENAFKRLHLNMRTSADKRWLSMDDWAKCGGPIRKKDLEGLVCYGAVDLATRNDLAAMALAFGKVENSELVGNVYLKCFFWAPSENAHLRERRDGVPYLTWARQGFIHLTEGNVIDFDFITKRVLEEASRYGLKEVAYDPYGATYWATSLYNRHGIPMVEFRQGTLSMNEPCKLLESLVVSGQLRHGDNPVLSWMAGNAAVYADANGNIKIDKKKSADKIDGMVAAAMAIGRLVYGVAQPVRRSYLESERLMVL